MKTCVDCREPLSRGRGTRCHKCYLHKIKTCGHDQRRQPWRWHCKQCGTRISARAVYCQAHRPYDGAWGRFNSSTTNPAAGRRRATHRFNLGSCERCGKPAIDRHHKDGNTFNNRADNVECLCRRCHMQLDGRLDALKTRNRCGRKLTVPSSIESGLGPECATKGGLT